jgi:hypothetical protein
LSDLEFQFCGHTVVPDRSSAAWFPGLKLLAVADLHFEKGSSFVRRGLHLPPYDTRATLKRLEEVVDRYAPDVVVALGDSFHDGTAPARLDEDDAASIRNLTGRSDWVWVFGNHDPVSAQWIDALGGRGTDQLEREGLSLRHEPVGLHGEVAGHLHPGAAIRQRGRRIRRRCFVTNGRSLVLPAFGAYTGSLNVLDEAFKPIFKGGFDAYLIGRDEIFPMSARRLVPDRSDDWRHALQIP